MSAVNRRDFALRLASAALLVKAAPAALAAPLPKRPPGPEQLARFWKHARRLGTRAAVIATADQTLLSEGSVTQPMRVASIRKSILSALYGMAVDAGKIDLSLTLQQLGLASQAGLTERESRATIRHLLQARSGIYIPATNETAAMRRKRPARGSHPPGSFWYYNNWDFNVLGQIYQQTTGEDLFDAVEQRLAIPLQWRDFVARDHTRWNLDPEYPRFPAYQLSLSARDLASFGQLFLGRRDGGGSPSLSERWIAESTRAWSVTGNDGWSSGYGYMWWVVTAKSAANNLRLPADMFTAAGNGGRFVSIIPSRNLVIAVQPNERPGWPPVPLYTRKNAYKRLIAELFSE